METHLRHDAGAQARAAMISGAFGGVILAVIEGLNIAMTKYFAKVCPVPLLCPCSLPIRPSADY